MYSLRKNLQKQTMNIDNAVDELRNSFSPLQITKFLLFVEKVKKKSKLLFEIFSLGKKINENDESA